MSFFDRLHPDRDHGSPADHDVLDHDHESVRRIEGGGIPVEAEERLRALGTSERPLASAPSVNDFALLANLGPVPVAQVLGASVLRVGRQYLPALRPYIRRDARSSGTLYEEPSIGQRWSYRWNETVVCELDAVTDAWNEVRRLAVGRLTEEALQVYADAVVGVKLERGDHDWSRRTIDYLISGTAIRSPASNRQQFPILSALSVQDYWRLRVAGYQPAGLLLATAVLFASPSRQLRLRRVRTVLENQELEEVTKAFTDARDVVRNRLESQARDVRADGIVGAQFSHTVHRDEFRAERSVQLVARPGWQRGRLGIPYYVSGGGEAERTGWVVTMHGVATAIRRVADVSTLPPETTIRLHS